MSSCALWSIPVRYVAIRPPDGFYPHFAHGGSKPVPIVDFERRSATPPFMALRNTVLKLLLNTNATGQGGNCFFDSGSPVFLHTGTGDVLVAAVSLKADQACVANGFNYRLDTPSARAFLGQFVTLP